VAGAIVGAEELKIEPRKERTMSDETFGNDLSNEERETHLNMTGDDHGTWTVFSDDPYWVRRLEKIGAELVRETGKGREYRLAANMVTIRKAPKHRKYTAEEKAAIAERLHAARAAADETTNSA
jgi:hypothetical protein